MCNTFNVMVSVFYNQKRHTHTHAHGHRGDFKALVRGCQWSLAYLSWQALQSAVQGHVLRQADYKSSVARKIAGKERYIDRLIDRSIY